MQIIKVDWNFSNNRSLFLIVQQIVTSFFDNRIYILFNMFNK